MCTVGAIKTVTFPFHSIPCKRNASSAVCRSITRPLPAYFRSVSVPFGPVHARARNTLTKYHAHARGHDRYLDVKIQLQESQPNFTSCQWDRLHLCYQDAILWVPAKLFVAGNCSVYSSWPLECCWTLPHGAGCCLSLKASLLRRADWLRRPVSVADVESTTPLRELFALRLVRSRTHVPLIQMAPHQYSVCTCIMPSCFHSIPISLYTIHRFQLHGNGIHFRIHGTERNGNVTIFMAPTVCVHQI